MAKQPQPASQPLTNDKKAAAIPLLKKRIADIEAYLPSAQDEQHNAALDQVNAKLQNTLDHIYAPGSLEHSRASSTFYVSGGSLNMAYTTSKSQWAKEQESSKRSAIAELEALISSFEEQLEAAGASAAAPSPSKRQIGRKVFIVHGRDDGAKQAVARFVERLGLESVILHEQASAGATLIEKLEHHADCDFCLVLLTSDDEGRLKGAIDLEPRARQNVIYELGYFVGRLQRKHVVALVAPGLVMPSDFHGVVFVALDNAGAWRLLVAKELKNAGLAVDLNNAM